MESTEIIQTTSSSSLRPPQKNLITTVVNGGIIHRDDDEQRVEIPIQYTSLKELLPPLNYFQRRNSGELECEILQIKHPLIKQAAIAYLSLSFKSMPPPPPEEDSHWWWKKVVRFRRSSDEDETSNKEDYSKVGCIDFFYEVVLGALGFPRRLDTKHD